MMRKQLLIASMAALLVSCSATENKEGFTKKESGFDYKIIKATQPGDSIKHRDIVKIALSQYIDDSLLNTTVGKMPVYAIAHTNEQPFDYVALLPLMQVNDSAVCLFATDEIIKRADSAAKVPPYLKKGKYIKVYFKVLASFSEEAEAMADMEKTQTSLVSYSKEDMAEGLKKAATAFDSLIQSLPQQPTRLPSGVYVQVTEKGNGPKVKQGQEIGVIFKGKLMNGTLVEEATATTPFLIHAGAGESLKGFDDAVSSLSIGDKATVYIPAPLAYGARKAGDYIPAFSNLIFDVAIINPLEKKK